MQIEKSLRKELFRQSYPSWGDLLMLLGVFVVSTVVGSIVVGILQKIGSVTPGFGTFLGYVIQFSLVIAFGLVQRYRRSPKGGALLKFGFKKVDFSIILWGVIMVIATGIVIEPLLGILPDKYMDQISNLMGTGGWMMLTAVVVAPLMEELLFRGIVQDALTRKYGAVRGVVIAAAVFGVVHIIPQQVINAFMVGLVLGYIYYRTGSLIPVIVIHCINNAISYFSWMMGGGKILTTREQLGDDTLYYIVYAIACILFVIACVTIWRRISRDEKRAQQAIAAEGAEKISGDDHTITPN